MTQESESAHFRSQAKKKPHTTSHESSQKKVEAAAAEHEVNITVDQLYNELRSAEIGSNEKNVRLTPEQQLEVILEQVLDTLFEESGFKFKESTVKENLNEILLVLIAHRSSDTHGKSLMGDLTAIFDTRLSPGTVYPQLHELEDDGLLNVQELVRTKEYQVNDEKELAKRVSVAMEQHLVLGLLFQAALSELPQID